MSNKKTWTYSFEWTQPYVAMNEFYIEKENKIDPRIETANELARLDFLEDEVQTMTSYPDAERVLANILK